MNDTPQTIWQSAKRFFSGTLLSRISGMLRDITLAYAFGTSSSLAAFLVGFRFAHLLRRLLGEGAFQTAFIPSFESIRSNNLQRGARFFCDLYASLSLLLIGLIALMMSGSAILLLADILSPGNAEILWLTLLMLPSLLFICLFGLNASLLQCERYFFVPAAAPVVFNVFWILGALLLRGLPPEQAMPWLAGFIGLACLGQWLVTVPETLKIIRSFNSSISFEGMRVFSNDVRSLARPLCLGILGIGAAQINSALDSIFARYASEEGPAFLWYAIRLQQLPLALIGIAFAGALLPALSRAVQTKQPERFRQLLMTTLRRCMLWMLPLTVGMFLFGGFAIQLLFGHGDFTQHSVEETTRCLWGYASGLIPMALVLVLAPSFYARQNYRTPTQASIASVFINALLSLWFVIGLNWGPASVAWATGISAWVNCCWLFAAYKRGNKDNRDFKDNKDNRDEMLHTLN